MEGLVSLLIDRCRGTMKRYEYIIFLLDEPTIKTHDEEHLLFSLLTKENDLDDNAKWRIHLAEEEISSFRVEEANALEVLEGI
jgi:hypothetical protein